MSDEDVYLDYIRPRGLPVLKATLRVIVAIQCLGAATQNLSMGVEWPVANFLVVEMDYGRVMVDQYATYAAYALIACGILTLLRPCWPVLLPVTVWFIAGSLVKVVRNESPLSILEPVEHAARYTAPLALMVLDFWPPSFKSHLGRTVVAMWLLRLAAAATFIGHGLVALYQAVNGGHFIDLLTSTTSAVLGRDLSMDEARAGLSIIGGVDLGVAISLLCSRAKPVALYMAAWGFATAATRMIAAGPAAFPETLVRVANGGLPLVLLLYWSLSIKEGPVEIVKAN